MSEAAQEARNQVRRIRALMRVFLMICFLCFFTSQPATAVAKTARGAKETRSARKVKTSAKLWNEQIRSRARLRFHFVTDALRARLGKAALRNVKSTGAYLGKSKSPQATVFLVSRLLPNGLALVLTNAHVTEGWEKGTVEFSRSASSKPISAKIVSTIATSRASDSSLVLVKFSPMAWFSSKLVPVRVSSHPLQAREKIYSTAFPSLDPRLANFEDIVSGHFGPAEASSQETGRQIESIGQAIAKTQQTIQTGFENGVGSTGRHLARIETSTITSVFGDKTTSVYALSLPNSPGSSGSPIFSAASHELVALHKGGHLFFDNRNASAVPIGRVLRGLKVDYLRKLQLEGQTLPQNINGLVTNFLALD